MSCNKDMMLEREIASPVRHSLGQIKRNVLAYQGCCPELQKLQAKTLDLESEAAGRKGSFPMEKFMGLVKKLRTNSSDPDVVLFLNAVQVHIDIIADGIQKLVERNLGLVGHLINQCSSHDISYCREDRMQDGSAGLVKAAYRFDPERNIKFSTYACWWIKQEARLGYMSMARTIRWPSNVYQAMGKGKDAFMSSMGRNGEVVYAATSLEPISINEPKNNECNEDFVNSLKSPNSLSLEDLVVNRQTAEIINDSIDSALTEREAQVIRARFGIDQQSDHILADIGQLLGVSPERVRHIQNSAVVKLQKCVVMGKLKENYA